MGNFELILLKYYYGILWFLDIDLCEKFCEEIYGLCDNRESWDVIWDMDWSCLELKVFINFLNVMEEIFMLWFYEVLWIIYNIVFNIVLFIIVMNCDYVG